MTAAYSPDRDSGRHRDPNSASADPVASSGAEHAAATRRPRCAVAAPTRMTRSELDEVVAIEARAYPFPWTRRNFEDSLDSGYTGLCVRDTAGHLLAYSVLMPVIDEVHLLNLCVAPEQQRQGLGTLMLAESVAAARVSKFASLLLEVRPSNLPALSLYERFGFQLIGRRKNYYPAANGTREDALVMRLEDLSANHLESLHVLA